MHNQEMINKYLNYYGDLMLVVKNRINTALKMLGPEHLPVSIINLESAGLQIRKALESIMYASVIVNIDRLPQGIAKEYNVNKLMAKVKSINPEYYPEPTKSIDDGNDKKWVPVDGFITKDEFKNLYNKIGELAHDKNPILSEKKIDNLLIKKQFIEALKKLIILLNHHQVRLPDSDNIIVCVMENGKGGVQTTYWDLKSGDIPQSENTN